jgi:prepilin-type N-terminal cleavage/methylation domain-containing protein
MLKHAKKGFTLIELLVVIAIIAILSVVVFVALDPVTRFADARDSRRFVDTNSILTAVHQKIVDQGGDLPAGLTRGMSDTEIGSCGTCADLAATLSAYLKEMPTDPRIGNASNSGYNVVVNTDGIVTITAPNAENASVSVSR